METFVVRLWVPTTDESEGAEVIRGVLECPGTADAKPFRGADQLLKLLESGLAAALDRRTAPERRREGT